MGRPAGGYVIADGPKKGKRVIGTTTVLNRFKDATGLLIWNNRMGLQGIDTSKVVESAADAGSACHAMIEADIYGSQFDPSPYPPEAVERANPAYRAYQRWKEPVKLTIIESELSLIDEDLEYGGTIDAVAEISGETCLLDWKTSSGVYTDYIIQLAAYGHLWNQHQPNNPIKGYHLLRVSKQKEPEDPICFEHRYWDQLDLAWEQFTLFLKAYHNDKRLKTFV